MDVRGRKALVTGAAKRIGFEIASSLAGKGAEILLHYNHSQQEAESAARKLEAQGAVCHLCPADLSTAEGVLGLTKNIGERFGGVDILVNSASLFYKTPVKETSAKSFDELVAVNLRAPFLLSFELGKKMAASSGGSILNITDWSGLRPYKDYAAYCATKGGLITLTKSLARDLAPKVRVNAIAPGPMFPPENMSEKEKEAVAKLTVLGRWGDPKDIANAVVFLLENDFINGTVLVVDGGRSLV